MTIAGPKQSLSEDRLMKISKLHSIALQGIDPVILFMKVSKSSAGARLQVLRERGKGRGLW